MNKILRLTTIVIFFIIINACGAKHQQKERENKHSLINTEQPNTYAFLGNSITHDGRYHSYFELFLLTRYPDVDFEFINAGVAGDQAGIALGRLQDDLLVQNPDVVTVMFGMNDIGRNLYGRENLEVDSMIRKQQQNLSNYATNLDSLTRIILNSGAELVLFTPSIYEQNAKNLAAPNMYGCNDALKECALMVKESQKEHDTYLVDHFSVMDSLNTLLQKNNPDTTIVGPDRVHPQDAGHFIMAYNIIRQLEYSPIVASTEINAAEKQINALNAKIDNIHFDADGLDFTYTPGSLPFPTTEFQDVAEFIGFNKNMNKELLKIQELSPGNYILTIDSEPIAVFKSQTLKEGINLSDYVTPQQAYAGKIATLIEHKREIISGKMRNVAFIEYFYAPEVMSAKDSIEALKIIDNRLAKDEGKSYYGYLESQVNLYKEVKKELPELKHRIDSLNQEINQLRRNIPEYKFVVKEYLN